jgi:hypothetical protein
MAITRRLICTAILLCHSGYLFQYNSLPHLLLTLFTAASALLLLFNYSTKPALAGACLMLLIEGINLFEEANAEEGASACKFANTSAANPASRPPPLN